MSDRLDKRKNAFKAKNLNSTERIRKEAEQARKDKRSTNVLAKRLRADPALEDNTTVYSEAAVNGAITQLKSGDHVMRMEGLRMLREILCSTHSNIELIVSSGTPVYLSSILASPNEDVRVEAAWCLTNIATGDHEQTGSVLCAVPYMVEILSSSRDSAELKEQICWAIGNIAGDCDDYRTVLHGNGCLTAVLKFLSECVSSAPGRAQVEEPVSGFRTAAWTLSNLARGTVLGQVFQATGQLPQLMRLMDSQHGREGAEEMWWLFAFLTAKEDAVVAHCIEQGLVEILTSELSKCSASSLSNIPLIRCLGNITSGPIEWMDRITSRPALIELLLQRIAYTGSVTRSGEGPVHKLVAKETLWVVCNILGALPHQRKAFLIHNTADAHPCLALERLLTVLQCDEYDVQQEAVFCLEQACADEDLLQLLLSSPVYRPHLLPLARLVERLLRSPSCDVPLSCMRIVSALTSAAKTSGSSSGSGGGGGGDSGRLCELVNMWVEAGITEALDDIQYSGGAASADSEGGRRVSEGAVALVEQLYAILEHEESSDTAETATGNAFASGDPVPPQHYTFGAPAAPTVFSFGPAPMEGPASPAAQFSEGLSAGLGGGARQGGVGRGSHLNKPSWMT